MQETYNDACGQIIDAQKAINEMVNSAEPEGVDDITKITKERTNALKIKDSAIRIKLEISKIQNDIIKHKGDAESAITERSGGNVSLDDYSKIRKMIKEGSKDTDGNK